MVHAVSGGPSAAVSAFSVDVGGLLEALTEQFPDPLLCVRELVQNAADAGARRIDVDISFDAGRGLTRLSVRDDGRGMGAQEVEGYLEIGRSEKGPGERGRFGIGKLSPYALGFSRMIVETCNGEELHRLEFEPDGSGRVEKLPAGPRGTVVKVFRAASREAAEQLSERAFALVKETCGSLSIPLYVNGMAVNHDVALSTPYVVRFEGEAGSGAIGVGTEPLRTLMGGGIVLETGAPILGSELSYILDGPRLSPTLSRNAVRRDRAFEDLLRQAQAQVPHLVASAAQVLRQHVERLRQQGDVVERALEADDRAALEWLRAHLLEPETSPSRAVREAPVLETADGDLVSASAVAAVLRTERRVPISRVPRTREEIAGYVDRGVPVLLLYRDLEDFLERQEIETVEVDGLDDGVEIEARAWSQGERALVARPAPVSPRRLRFEWGLGVALGVLVLALVASVAVVFPGAPSTPSAPPPIVSPVPTPPTSPVSEAPPASPSRRWVSLGFAFTAGVGVAVLVVLFFGIRQGRWLRDDGNLAFARGSGRHRRLLVLLRAALHPFDFVVARGFGRRPRGPTGKAIAGYRAFVAETPVRAGMRLDLDSLELGFVDMVSRTGEPSDARLVARRSGRVLLNRNHPTVQDLIRIATIDPPRAHLLLETLLATDPDLGRGSDPRQVEWDLVARAPRLLG